MPDIGHGVANLGRSRGPQGAVVPTVSEHSEPDHDVGVDTVELLAD